MAAKKKRGAKKNARARGAAASSSSDAATLSAESPGAPPALELPPSPEPEAAAQAAATTAPLSDEAKASAAKALEELAARARGAAPRAPLGVAAAAPADESVFEFSDLEELGEFLVWGAFELIPEAMGGGELTQKQERMLSKCWTKALVPYLNTQHAPLAIAAVLSVEVLFKRATQYRARRAVAAISGADGAKS